MGRFCHRSITATATAVFSILIAVVLRGAIASGIFELDLLSLDIRDVRDISGDCCRPRGANDSTCPETGCPVALHFCVTHYQQQVDMRSSCTFFEFDTARLDREGRTHAYDVRPQRRVSVDFEFRWPGPFSLVVEAWHRPEGSERGKTLVERFVSQQDVEVDPEWTFADLPTPRSLLRIKYRVVCAANYHGPKCAVYCRDRNDKFGHYTCTADGNRKCLPGWTNKEGGNDTYCNTPHCDPECVHGICSNDSEDQNVCRCLSGWTGPSCNKCTPLYNCVHGKCETDPKQCFCDEGWGGLQCDQDLNYCTNHKPCQHGGTCTNTVKDGKGLYNCSCSKDFMGENCEIPKNPCHDNPCENGASCKNPSDGQFECACVPGYFGPRCETWANICSDNQCVNGGSCIHDPNGFICACPVGFAGLYCEEVDEHNCQAYPCLNDGECIKSKTGFHCHCPPGIAGPRCENTPRCSPTSCENGGTCVEQPRSANVTCLCPLGFAGPLCQTSLNRCSANPCANGATCLNLVDDFRCQCARGYHGQFCHLQQHDPCASSPCLNGAACRPTQGGGFACRCHLGFSGARCHLSSDPVMASNVSHRVSVDEGAAPAAASGADVALISGLACALVALVVLAACVAKCALRRRRQKRQQHPPLPPKECDFEAERLQNERNASLLHMNNKQQQQCDSAAPPHQIIVNELDRGPAKMVNSGAVHAPKVLNVEPQRSPDKSVMLCPPARTVQKSDNTTSGCSSVSSRLSQDYSHYPSGGGVYVIEDHLKLHPSIDPSLRKEDILATEV